VALFTTAIQVSQLAHVARQEGIEDAAIESLRRRFVGSIGPTTTEALEEFGIHPAFEPSHPKMRILVLEAAQRVSAATGKSAE
jgi:uroporphyrinogen-III synthase